MTRCMSRVLPMEGSASCIGLRGVSVVVFSKPFTSFIQSKSNSLQGRLVLPVIAVRETLACYSKTDRESNVRNVLRLYSPDACAFPRRVKCAEADKAELETDLHLFD